MSLVSRPLSLRYVFFGSAAIAPAIIGDMAEAGMPPAVVVCNPDRPAGRKKTITPPPAKLAAEKHGIPVLQPENPADIADRLRAERYDCFVVAAYAKIMPREFIGIPRHGTIGVHPSLLPKYRGASPIKSAILYGAPETGITLYAMDQKVDHGPIIAREKLSDYRRDEDTDAVLMEKLAHFAARLLHEALPRYVAGEITPTFQDEAQATFTKKFTSKDGFVEEAELERAISGADFPAALRIHRMILALGEEPGVWTRENGKRKKLLKSDFKDGRLILRVVQREGERPITLRE